MVLTALRLRSSLGSADGGHVVCGTQERQKWCGGEGSVSCSDDKLWLGIIAAFSNELVAWLAGGAGAHVL